MDKLNWVFGAVLVLIGGFGVLYARKTLKAIEGQLAEIKSAGQQTDLLIKHAGVQADAARENSQALMKANRAWMLIDSIDPVNLNPLVVGVPKAHYTFCHLKNFGDTPAMLLESHSHLELQLGDNMEGPPDISVCKASASTTEYRRVIPPSAALIIEARIKSLLLSDEDVLKIKNSEKFL